MVLSLHGILNVNKPPGLTSFQAVALVRRWSGVRRVGHAGTLDWGADGVVPVCLGQATRVVEFLQAQPKVYRAQLQLGMVTDTYDSQGQVIEERDFSALTLDVVSKAAGAFVGEIWQVPPPYSALRYQGRRLHQLARAGIEVKIPPRKVHIYSLELLAWQPPFLVLEVECGKGVYIRSLAHDLGQALGCGASVVALTRLRYGPFQIESAIPLRDWEQVSREGTWLSYLHPVDKALADLPALVVSGEEEAAVRSGRSILVSSDLPGAEICRAYDQAGSLLAVLRRQEQAWHPYKVFNLPQGRES